MPLEINSTCWGFFISWFWPWDQDSWGPNLVWHYLKAERLFSLCFWKFLVQTDPNKTKTVWLEQGCETYPFYPHPFDISTGAKSGKYLCWKDIFNLFCFVLFCFGLRRTACGTLVPQQGLNPCPQQWARRVLTIAPTGNSLFCFV